MRGGGRNDSLMTLTSNFSEGGALVCFYLGSKRSVDKINCITAKDMSEERTKLSRLLTRSLFIHEYFRCFLFFFSWT